MLHVRRLPMAREVKREGKGERGSAQTGKKRVYRTSGCGREQKRKNRTHCLRLYNARSTTARENKKQSIRVVVLSLSSRIRNQFSFLHRCAFSSLASEVLGARLTFAGVLGSLRLSLRIPKISSASGEPARGTSLRRDTLTGLTPSL